MAIKLLIIIIFEFEKEIYIEISYCTNILLCFLNVNKKEQALHYCIHKLIFFRAKKDILCVNFCKIRRIKLLKLLYA